MANFFLKGELNFENKYKNVRIVIPNKVITNVTDKISKNYESNVSDQTKSQTTQSSTYKFRLEEKIF